MCAFFDDVTVVGGAGTIFVGRGAVIGGEVVVRGDVAGVRVGELFMSFGGLVMGVRATLLGLRGQIGRAYRRDASPVGVLLRRVRLLGGRPVTLAELLVELFLSGG